MDEVEKLLANVLKKSGLQPQMPKCLESRQEPKETEGPAATSSAGRSSRRRKPKRLREEKEKEKEKERKEKEKARYQSPEPYNAKCRRQSVQYTSARVSAANAISAL